MHSPSGIWTIPALLQVLLSHPAAAFEPATALHRRDCQGWTPIQRSYSRLAENEAYTISAGFVCANSTTVSNQTNCHIGDICFAGPGTGSVSVPRQDNITTSEDERNNLFDLVTKQTGLTFPKSVSVSFTPTGAGFCLAPGEAGHVVFLPELTCTSGRLSDCNGDQAAWSGQVVEACASLEASNEAGGTISFQNTTISAAQNLTTNPAASSASRSVGAMMRTKLLGLVVVFIVGLGLV